MKTTSSMSKILKGLMAELGINESELARRTGVGQPVVHRICSGETDNPKVATLSPIANFFAISISQLIGDEPLSADRIPGTFNPDAQGWRQIPLLTWPQVLYWPNLPEKLAPLPTISTDINMSGFDVTNIDEVSTSATTMKLQSVLNSTLIFYANNC